MDLEQHFKSLLYLAHMYYHSNSTVSYVLTSTDQRISHETSIELQNKDERYTSSSATILAQ